MAMDAYNKNPTNQNIPSYVINLEDKIHRWEKFAELNLGIQRIAAVDTRKTPHSHIDFNLKLGPPDKLTKLYFSQCGGALGCLLSHYVFWKHVVDNKLEYAIIFEDDALISDVKKVVTSSMVSDYFLNCSQPKLVQLNKRTTPEKLPFWFNGTECYAVNQKAAQSLIKLTHDFSDMKDTFIPYAWDSPHMLPLTEEQLYKRWKSHDDNMDFIAKDTIRYPADKFIGYCSHQKISPEHRLEIIIDPQVDLFSNTIRSDVMESSKGWWEMTFKEIEESFSKESYEWWKKK